MRIVIDMQGVQGSNRQHGIGRYTLSLAQAVVRNRSQHTVILALNGLFPDTIEPIRSAFSGLLPQENIRVWQAPGPVRYEHGQNEWRRRTAELVREAFLGNLEPDFVLVSSLFEGPRDDTVTSIGMLSRTVPTAVILYDLIPLIQRYLYLANSEYERWYENKLDHLRRADLLLAISESSREEAMRYLGFAHQLCVNISAAVGPQFQPQQIATKQEREIRQRYRLYRPFVMYTAGMSPRKNIEGLIRAYARQNSQVRANHQLLIVCSNLAVASRETLESVARRHRLGTDEFVLVEFVSDEDLLALYNLCKVFIFPSLHEGFGLPVLEAMSCGRAVIGSNTSSLPEVIGRDDALFDPTSDVSIADKLALILSDDAFRLELEQHGLQQSKKFSWEASAQRTISTIENCRNRKDTRPSSSVLAARRPKLAYISPLPPLHSGISDYSSELLPELSQHYDIEVVVEQDIISCPWVEANSQVRSVEWFKSHADRYDRVIYHFGNNYFHLHMFDLLEVIPGVVVLHDFFLSGAVGHRHFSGQESSSWIQDLYRCHGYTALQQHFDPPASSDVPWRYPCNLTVLQHAYGIVVHSEHSRRLANDWYGQGASDDWIVIPLVRAPAFGFNRLEARRRLKIRNDDFVVCCFGVIGPHKLNHCLVKAWLASALARDPSCKLIFVGENHGGEYGRELHATIHRSKLGERIAITGWVDTGTFRQYLAVADMGVQLRTLSRGETSASVLDCMNFGLPTIVNANGSMAYLPDDAVWKLPEEFEEAELVAALESLWGDAVRRRKLGARARDIVLDQHSPRNCAKQYAEAIEAAYCSATTKLQALSHAVAQVKPAPSVSSQDWVLLADAVAISVPPRPYPKQLLVDISELVQRDSKSGIQRVVRSVLRELLTRPPQGFRVEPIYATTDQGYRYARCFTLNFLNSPVPGLIDDSVEFTSGDVFLGLDLQPQVVPAQQSFYRKLRYYGVNVQFVVYDLLPITLAEAFPEWATKAHQTWLNVVTENDGAICISRAVAGELQHWLSANGQARQRPFKIKTFKLGADIVASCPSKGLPEAADNFLAALANRPSFLMVGTLEPRKGHVQTLAAFERLWAEGVDTNLVIVGKQGWMVDDLVEKIRRSSFYGKRLHWLEATSDEYLEKIYEASSALLVASEGEGFGLPIIEAARHGLSVIARDLPVFLEVAGKHAFYFGGKEPESLAVAIKEWLDLYSRGMAPRSDDIPWITWQESAQRLIDVIFNLG
jgi:glycosyltransferase involved in cell wall biosynthesis